MASTEEGKLLTKRYPYRLRTTLYKGYSTTRHTITDICSFTYSFDCATGIEAVGLQHYPTILVDSEESLPKHAIGKFHRE